MKTYAKIQNGSFIYSPAKVICNNVQIFNPSADVLLDLGFLPVKYNDMPTDVPQGQHYELRWEQTADAIEQVWTLVDDPEVPEQDLSMADLIEAIERGLTI